MHIRTVVLSLFATVSLNIAYCASTEAEDRAAIQRVVDDMWVAWNQHHPAAIVKDYTPDHDHISVFGGWHQGKADLLKTYERNFAPGGVFDHAPPTLGAGVIKLRLIRPEVGVAIVGAKDPADPGGMMSTWVFQKQNGRWVVPHFHNTMTFDPLSPPSPAKRQSGPPVVSGERAKADENAVRQVIAAFWAAWNRHDALGIVKDFSEDHDHMNVFAGFSEWMRRRDHAYLAYQRAHGPGGLFRESSVQSAVIEKLRFMKPDVVVAIVETTWKDNNRSRSTCVLSREPQGWVITNMQITAETDASKYPVPKQN
jgi:uncharacterized protein (TIGR02246 family)